MRCLFLTTVLPHSPRSGGEIVSKLFIETMMGLGIAVDVLGYRRERQDVYRDTENFISAGARVIESKDSIVASALWLIKSLLLSEAYTVQKYISRRYKGTLIDLLKKTPYDFIVIDHLQIAWVTKYIPYNLKTIYIAHNVESDLYKGLAESSSSLMKKTVYGLESKKILDVERKILIRATQTWCLTQNDQDKYKEISKSDTPNLHTFDCPSLITPTQQLPDELHCDVGLIGTWTWDANKRALEFFVNSIYPLLPKEIKITVAGKGADEILSTAPSIKYIGFVSSAEAFMRSSKVLALPAVAGAGIQIKTIDAINIGRPVVASSFALRGLSEVPSFVHSTDDPSVFAKKIIELLASNIYAYPNEAKDWHNRRLNNFTGTIRDALFPQ